MLKKSSEQKRQHLRRRPTKTQKVFPFQLPKQVSSSDTAERVLTLTASTNSSSTSVASLECSPCRSSMASVLSSEDDLDSPPMSLLAIPKHIPNPPPHVRPRALRSPRSSDQFRSRLLTACSASLARSLTSLPAASVISLLIFALRSCPSRLNRLAAAPSPRLHASAARERHAFRAAPSCSARERYDM